MSKREVKLYLTDIDDAVSTIRSYARGMSMPLEGSGNY